jgi:phage gp46-like protein
MADIKIRQNETAYTEKLYLPDLVFNNDTGYADLKIGDDGGLQCENAIETSILLQLFTNARLEENDVLSEKDPQGWIGDCFDNQDDFIIGSHLWTIDGIKTTEPQDKLKSYATLAIDKFKQQGLIKNYSVNVYFENDVVIFDIIIYSNYRDKTNIKFSLAWNQIYA